MMTALILMLKKSPNREPGTHYEVHIQYSSAPDKNSEEMITEHEDDESIGAKVVSRHPRRTRRQASSWWMASSATTSGIVTVTTSDEPTLSEVLNSTPEELDVLQSAIEAELSLLKSKSAWHIDENPGSQPLPTHIIR